MESKSILFSRGDSDDENDVWDDTALIRAYDKAVNKIKTDLSNTSDKNSKKKKSNKKESKRKSEVTTDSNVNWKVGDHCVAVYTEDGVSYPAVIIDINNKDNTCRIRYDIYENEEDKSLDELFESTDNVEKIEDEVVEDVEVKKKSEKKLSKSGKAKKQPLNFPIPPPPPPLPSSLISHFNDMNLDENGTVVDDKEAFYSMLMSWYMSGYHTGYYFGQTQREFQNQEDK
jgi:survival motor neuron protein